MLYWFVFNFKNRHSYFMKNKEQYGFLQEQYFKVHLVSVFNISFYIKIFFFCLKEFKHLENLILSDEIFGKIDSQPSNLDLYAFMVCISLCKEFSSRTVVRHLQMQRQEPLRQQVVILSIYLASSRSQTSSCCLLK